MASAAFVAGDIGVVEERVVLKQGTAEEGCAGTEVESYVALQADRAGDVVTGGEEENAAVCHGGDDFLNGGGVVGFAVTDDTVGGYVDEGGLGGCGGDGGGD